MLSFREVVMYMAMAMVLPTILGLLSSVTKKAGNLFLTLGGVIAALPLVPIVYFLINKFFLHPELYGPTNWNAILVLTLEFITVSLAIIDALVFGSAFTKDPPPKVLFYLLVSLIVCSGFFYGLDYFNNNMNQVHVVLSDVMNIR